MRQNKGTEFIKGYPESGGLAGYPFLYPFLIERPIQVIVKSGAHWKRDGKSKTNMLQ